MTFEQWELKSKSLCLNTFDDEIWIPIKGYELEYMISNFSRVKSLEKEVVFGYGAIRHHKEMIMKQQISTSGYVYLELPNKNGGNRRYSACLIHRLVSIGFIENKLNYPIVNHKNGIKIDNRIENLEWCTYSQNNIHAIKNKLYIPSKLPKITRMVINKNNGKIYNSIKDCAIDNNIKEKSLYYYLSKKDSNKYGIKYLDNNKTISK